MTDITDQDRRDALAWAANVSNQGKSPHLALTTAARVILATVDAPEPTLAEALKYRADLLDNGDPDGDTPQALRDLATDAAQMERDLAEARAEVARLTAERDGAREEIAWLRNGPGHTEVATPTAPADVPAGEAWIVEVNGERRTAVKNTEDYFQWNTVTARGWLSSVGNADITLITHLIPAPRVVTTAAELDQLPDGTIIRDHDDDEAMQKIEGRWVGSEGGDVLSSDWLGSGTFTATVLWEPES